MNERGASAVQTAGLAAVAAVVVAMLLGGADEIGRVLDDGVRRAVCAVSSGSRCGGDQGGAVAGSEQGAPGRPRVTSRPVGGRPAAGTVGTTGLPDSVEAAEGAAAAAVAPVAIGGGCVSGVDRCVAAEALLPSSSPTIFIDDTLPLDARAAVERAVSDIDGRTAVSFTRVSDAASATVVVTGGDAPVFTGSGVDRERVWGKTSCAGRVVGRSCDRKQVMLDTRVGADRWEALAAHELGHVLGLSHRDDATSSMSVSQWRTGVSPEEIAAIDTAYQGIDVAADRVVTFVDVARPLTLTDLRVPGEASAFSGATPTVMPMADGSSLDFSSWKTWKPSQPLPTFDVSKALTVDDLGPFVTDGSLPSLQLPELSSIANPPDVSFDPPTATMAAAAPTLDLASLDVSSWETWQPSQPLPAYEPETTRHDLSFDPDAVLAAAPGAAQEPTTQAAVAPGAAQQPATELGAAAAPVPEQSSTDAPAATGVLSTVNGILRDGRAGLAQPSTTPSGAIGTQIASRILPGFSEGLGGTVSLRTSDGRAFDTPTAVLRTGVAYRPEQLIVIDPDSVETQSNGLQFVTVTRYDLDGTVTEERMPAHMFVNGVRPASPADIDGYADAYANASEGADLSARIAAISTDASSTDQFIDRWYATEREVSTATQLSPVLDPRSRVGYTHPVTGEAFTEQLRGYYGSQFVPGDASTIAADAGFPVPPSDFPLNQTLAAATGDRRYEMIAEQQRRDATLDVGTAYVRALVAQGYDERSAQQAALAAFDAPAAGGSWRDDLLGTVSSTTRQVAAIEQQVRTEAATTQQAVLDASQAQRDAEFAELQRQSLALTEQLGAWQLDHPDDLTTDELAALYSDDSLLTPEQLAALPGPTVIPPREALTSDFFSRASLYELFGESSLAEVDPNASEVEQAATVLENTAIRTQAALAPSNRMTIEVPERRPFLEWWPQPTPAQRLDRVPLGTPPDEVDRYLRPQNPFVYTIDGILNSTAVRVNIPWRGRQVPVDLSPLDVSSIALLPVSGAARVAQLPRVASGLATTGQVLDAASYIPPTGALLYNVATGDVDGALANAGTIALGRAIDGTVDLAGGSVVNGVRRLGGRSVNAVPSPSIPDLDQPLPINRASDPLPLFDYANTRQPTALGSPPQPSTPLAGALTLDGASDPLPSFSYRESRRPPVDLELRGQPPTGPITAYPGGILQLPGDTRTAARLDLDPITDGVTPALPEPQPRVRLLSEPNQLAEARDRATIGVGPIEASHTWDRRTHTASLGGRLSISQALVPLPRAARSDADISRDLRENSTSSGIGTRLAVYSSLQGGGNQYYVDVLGLQASTSPEGRFRLSPVVWDAKTSRYVDKDTVRAIRRLRAPGVVNLHGGFGLPRGLAHTATSIERAATTTVPAFDCGVVARIAVEWRCGAGAYNERVLREALTNRRPSLDTGVPTDGAADETLPVLGVPLLAPQIPAPAIPADTWGSEIEVLDQIRRQQLRDPDSGR